MSDLVLTGIGRLITNDPARNAGLLGAVGEAALAISGGKVEWIGRRPELPSKYRHHAELDCDGRAVVPGFVDCHTHLLFAGDRAEEFAMRRAGASYEEILKAGGGIHSTVAATRATAIDELVDLALERVRRMVGFGTTTVEMKTGYGLSPSEEARLLEAGAAVAADSPADVVLTLLGAHVVPLEMQEDRNEYLRQIVEEMIPAASHVASFCDVFCDSGAFTLAEARTILETAAAHGLGLKIHAEQLTRTGAAAMAAELGAVSADHLDHVTEADIARLAAAPTVAVLLPTVSLSLGIDQPPARRLWDAGVRVAIATDCNPGTSNVENMQLVIAIACLEAGLSPDEALWAATRGGAMALAMDDKGLIRPGVPADLVVLDADSHIEIPYRPGSDLVRMVIKDGVVVATA